MSDRQTLHRLSDKAGLPPGALVHVGNKFESKVRISVVRYSEDVYDQRSECTIEELAQILTQPGNFWINVDGLHDTELMTSLGQILLLPNTVLEDVMNTLLRPRLEETDTLLFMNLKMMGLGVEADSLVSEQLSMILTNNTLISFQEQEGDLFDSIRQRLRDNKGNVRSKAPVWFFYRLLDTAVDNYFHVTEYLTDSIEKIEDQIEDEVDKKLLITLQDLRKTLLRFRRMVLPLREPTMFLYKDDLQFIPESMQPHLRDVNESVLSILEALESLRERLGGATDFYHTSVSNRMNQIMQVLTIISTIFIPLTFIAGIYGMNFEQMPELSHPYAYPIVWGVMILITIVMLILFRKKKWL